MWFLNLLTNASESSSSVASSGGGWQIWVIFGVGILAIVGMSWFNNRSQRKRQQEMQEQLRAIKPGNKVKTIGGICGVVVEVNPEDNTFVLETGNEANGVSYLRFDMIAIYQTDAKKEDAQPAQETQPAQESQPAQEELVAETEESQEAKDE